jgi:quercetin dioxygenase-like cupin family protein
MGDTEDRLKQLDAAELTVQVLSYPIAGPDLLPAAGSVAMGEIQTIGLQAASLLFPDATRGFSHLPLTDRDASADEFERRITQPGFSGALVSGAALSFVLCYELGRIRNMPDKSITKVSSADAPKGRFGQKYLASGIHISIRLWEREPPGEAKSQTGRDYETVGFVLEGKAELHIEGQLVLLEKGDSWVVPKGSRHTYKIIETFTAVEATSPPAEVHARDE